MNNRWNMQDQEKVRVFFALWPSPDVREQLHSMARQCQRRHGGRVMHADTLHMTMLFVGEIQVSAIQTLIQQVDATDIPPFSFMLQEIRCWKHNRIAYAAPSRENTALMALSERLKRAAQTAGVEFDRRPFTPHVTLVRKLERPFENMPLAIMEWQVSEFALVASEANAQGARYRNLHVWSCRD